MIISRTPLRISLVGGGSDLSEYYKTGFGAVISTAIDRYVYITVNKKFDDLIRVSYSKTEIVKSVEELEHNIIREALKLVGIEKKIEVVYMGDIPLGSAGVGLGSSSSLAVGVLNALYAFKGNHISAERLARDACKIEIETLGYPMGKQDQYIGAYGGFNYIQFNKDETVYVDPIICKSETKVKLNSKLMLFFTGVERVSSSILEEQKQETGANLNYLDKIVELAKILREGLINNKIEDVGDILHQGWLYKKKLAAGITNSKIDEYYAKARKAGARGGKILGAGGGGFLLLYCDEKHQDKVREALADLKGDNFKFEPQGSKIIYVHD
jgi:D-glycero-alpha-D-manno-heptose-7-phosphate kinase